MVTKREALEHFETVTALAKTLGVSHSAVSQWEIDEPLPILRQWQLHSLFPKKFPAPPMDGKAA